MKRKHVAYIQCNIPKGGVFMSYYIGIDIAKNKHDCFIQNDNGEVIANPFSFANSSNGFNLLLDKLNSLDSLQKIKIGLEATGHYGFNLKQFLETNEYDFMEFNPLLIKRFSESTTLRRTKTDKVDSILISTYLTTVTYKPYPNKSYHIQAIKSLTRNRESLIKERSLSLVRITNILDKIFPEFKPFFNNSLKSVTCMYLLTNYSNPKKISKMNLKAYKKMSSKIGRTISYARFIQLKDLAKNSIGTSDDIYDFELKCSLDLYNLLNKQIKQIELKIKNEYAKCHNHINTIRGISTTNAAAIFAEYGDINAFDNSGQMLSYAGLKPSKIQSGQSDYNGRMVKHGSSHLRYTLMNVSMTFMMHNPIIYDYYHKKRNEGKCHRVALSHVAKKLIRIIYHLEKYDLDFDSNKL